MPPPQKPGQIESEHQAVFTVTEYYDGPVKGIANFNGKPHFYECIYDPAKSEYSELFRLTPLDDRVLRLAMEDWEIWRRWEHAFHTGKTSMQTHPALPQDKSRHQELEALLGTALRTGANAITRIGKFVAPSEAEYPRGVIRPLKVRWLDPTRPHGMKIETFASFA